ncbi:DUF411 domain-containing protein [Methylomonas paludis]|uniref:DUF411 domain-containing protein n=1 Tax=Methylomonas paludis TaxID=1173101 RepID=A0A975MP75_9GAMM|nr:DUF411 domain-containing protein [Methylomonas paludis]QWF70944.1 DUF411 domain-containing protein [Methylomonas paludis]
MLSLNRTPLLLLLLASLNIGAAESDKAIDITVYRSESCSCCRKWQDHLQQNNFNIKSLVSDDLQAVKDKYGIPDKLASCHTALVNGYIVEGHVPAQDIRKLLQTKPNIVGIAAPGMPMGSPGMEMGDTQASFQVISVDKSGHFEVFSNHNGNQ